MKPKSLKRANIEERIGKIVILSLIAMVIGILIWNSITAVTE
jgi:hypothetical protein